MINYQHEPSQLAQLESNSHESILSFKANDLFMSYG